MANRRPVHNKHIRRFRSLSFSFAVTGKALILCCVVLWLSSCSGVSISNPFSTPSKSGHTGGSGSSVTPITSPTTTKAVSPTPTAPITFQGAAGCPTLSINWDTLVGTHTNVNKVQKVYCGSLEGAGSLTALVNVRSYGSDAKLDFYVYDNLYGTPAQRFKMQGLLDGDAKISPTNTIITAEIGAGGVASAAPDLFKEFAWNTSGTFGQILFPGMYPDMTHYQAEQSQVAVTAGRDTWKNTGFPIVSNLALHLFHWNNVTNKTITFDSTHGIYIIECMNNGPGGGGFFVHLFRLDNLTTNIFEAMQITPIDGTTSLSTPASGAQVSSPVSIGGYAPANKSVLGDVLLYDDSYFTVGDSGAIHSSASSGYVTFQTSVKYHVGGHGLQEGLAAFYSTNQNSVYVKNQGIMVKVFFTS